MSEVREVIVIQEELHIRLKNEKYPNQSVKIALRSSESEYYQFTLSDFKDKGIPIPVNLYGKRIRIYEIIKDLEVFIQSLIIPKKPKLFPDEITNMVIVSFTEDIKDIFRKGKL